MRKKIHPKTSEEVNLRSSKISKMNFGKKTMMLYINFRCLKDILASCKESYCSDDIDIENFTDIQYIAVGNMIKRLTQTEADIETYFEDHLGLDSKYFDQDFSDKISKNIFDKYKIITDEGKDILSMLAKDFNAIIKHTASLAGLPTHVVNYYARTQEEYVIV